MIKRLRVTVDGNTYDVTVEMPDEPVAQPPPLASAPVAQAAAPAAAPAQPIPPPIAPLSAPAAPSGPATPADVPSPLAGRVTAVVVSPGQAVKEGDHLLTLE